MKKQEKKDLWALMCPDAAQRLAEALEKTDEDVAESLRARGYDLARLDAELLALVDRLPSRRRKTRGFASHVAMAIGALGAASATVYVAAAAIATAELPEEPTPVGAAPPQDSPAMTADAGHEDGGDQ